MGDGVVFVIKLILKWGCIIQAFESRKILASSNLKVGRFTVKRLHHLITYQLAHIYIPFLNHNLKTRPIETSVLRYLGTQIGSLIYWPQKLVYNRVGVLSGQWHIPRKN